MVMLLKRFQFICGQNPAVLGDLASALTIMAGLLEKQGSVSKDSQLLHLFQVTLPQLLLQLGSRPIRGHLLPFMG